MKINIKETVSEVECLAVTKFTQSISYSISVHKRGLIHVKYNKKRTFINMFNHMLFFLTKIFRLLS